MHEYDKSTIEDFIKKIRGNHIKNIFPVKLFKVTYIENHYGNYCYYLPYYTSQEYNFTLDDAKEVCLDNRKAGRQFEISETVALYVESIACRVLLLTNIGGINSFYLVCNMFRERPMIDTFIFYMFILSSFKNRGNALCIDLFNIYKNEICTSMVRTCNTLKVYLSEFSNGFLSWDINEYPHDNINFFISEYIKNLQ